MKYLTNRRAAVFCIPQTNVSLTLHLPSFATKMAFATLGLLAFNVCAIAQEPSMTLIKGQITRDRIPDEITLNSVHNGKTVLHSTVKVSQDGAFGFYFQPDRTGFFTVGERGDAARLYLTPGRNVELTLADGTYSVNEDDRENTLLANWAATIWELKKCNQLRGLHTYKEVFPMLPKLEEATEDFKSMPTGEDADFGRMFKKLVAAEFEYELYHFLYMPRTLHPTRDDYPEIYERISNEPRFFDDTAMHLDFGQQYVDLYIMFQYSRLRENAEETASREQVCQKYIQDEVVRGWYFARNVLTRARAYDDAYIAKLDEYRKFLVTQEQRKYVSDFVLTINRFATGEPAFDFAGTTTDDAKVQLSDLKGKVVVVDVWATWCGPCIKQIPHLRELEEELAGEDIAFVSYSVDKPEDREKWKTMVSEKELGGIQIMGDTAFQSPICTNYQIKSIPRFLAIDKSGKVITIDAPRPSDPKLKALLKKYLEE